MKVVIVGGVAGGASCAARLRRLDEAARAFGIFLEIHDMTIPSLTPSSRQAV